MLQPCPECEEEVSSEAYACPHCGMPLTEMPHEPSFIEDVVESLDETITESMPFLQQLFGCLIWIVIATSVLFVALLFFAVMC